MRRTNAGLLIATGFAALAVFCQLFGAKDAANTATWFALIALIVTWLLGD